MAATENTAAAMKLLQILVAHLINNPNDFKPTGLQNKSTVKEVSVNKNENAFINYPDKKSCTILKV